MPTSGKSKSRERCQNWAGGNHLDAVRVLEKVGFHIARQGKHIVMTDGSRIVTIPRHNPVNAFTSGGIAPTPA